MKHERTYLLTNGDSLKIEVAFHADSLRNSFGYSVIASVKRKGKRMFELLPIDKYKDTVIESRIKETQRELWQTLKP